MLQPLRKKLLPISFRKMQKRPSKTLKPPRIPGLQPSRPPTPQRKPLPSTRRIRFYLANCRLHNALTSMFMGR